MNIYISVWNVSVCIINYIYKLYIYIYIYSLYLLSVTCYGAIIADNLLIVYFNFFSFISSSSPLQSSISTTCIFLSMNNLLVYLACRLSQKAKAVVSLFIFSRKLSTGDRTALWEQKCPVLPNLCRACESEDKGIFFGLLFCASSRIPFEATFLMN